MRPGPAPMVMRAAPLLFLAATTLLLRLLGQAELAALFGLSGLAVCAGRHVGRPARLAMAVVLSAFALGLWLYPGSIWLLVRMLPVLGILLMAVHFGATLLPGREPLITRYTRYDPGVRLEECAGYTRMLTLLWTLLFLALAPFYALALSGLPPFQGPPDHSTVFGVSGLLMLMFFLGEHIIRTLRFPHFGRATPARTLRAVIAATLAPHA